MRRPGNLGISPPRLGDDEAVGHRRSRPGGTPPRPAQPAPQGRPIPRQGRRLPRQPQEPRTDLRLRSGRQRAERLGRRNRDSPDLRLVGRAPRCALSYLEKPQPPRKTHPPRPRHGRTHRQRRQAERLDLRRRSRLSGRSRRSLRHGRRPASSSAARLRRSNTPPRWASNTIWD